MNKAKVVTIGLLLLTISGMGYGYRIADVTSSEDGSSSEHKVRKPTRTAADVESEQRRRIVQLEKENKKLRAEAEKRQDRYDRQESRHNDLKKSLEEEKRRADQMAAKNAELRERLALVEKQVDIQKATIDAQQFAVDRAYCGPRVLGAQGPVDDNGAGAGQQ